MDPPFPPPETAPPAPPVDPDQEFASSPETAEKFSLTAAMDGRGGYVEQENGHSMPNLEEARTEGAIASGGSYRKDGLLGFGQRRRGLMLLALGVGAIVLIAAFSIAISSNRKDLSSSATESGGWVSGVSRLRDVQQFLAVRISEASLLEEVDTPQNKAALWIADQDELQVPLPSDPANYDTSYQFVQRYIMAVFYFALDGPKWTNQISFLSSKDVCDWNQPLNPSVTPEHEHAENWDYGVRCTDGTITHIFICKWSLCLRVVGGCLCSMARLCDGFCFSQLTFLCMYSSQQPLTNSRVNFHTKWVTCSTSSTCRSSTTRSLERSIPSSSTWRSWVFWPWR